MKLNYLHVLEGYLQGYRVYHIENKCSHLGLKGFYEHELKKKNAVERVIKGTKILAEIKRIQSRYKDQTWKTDNQRIENEHSCTPTL